MAIQLNLSDWIYVPDEERSWESSIEWSPIDADDKPQVVISSSFAPMKKYSKDLGSGILGD